MAGTSSLQQLLARLRRTGAPLSFSLLALEVVAFLLFFLTSGAGGRGLLENTAFTSSSALSHPWALVTYAFAWPYDAVWLALFVFLGLYYFAPALERGMGTQAFARLVLFVTLSAPIAFWAGAAALHLEARLGSPLLPVSAVIVGWATKYPEATVMLWFVVPVRAKWLGVLTAVFVALGYGWGTPALSVFALVPLALAHFWVKKGDSLRFVGDKPRGEQDGLSAWERQRKEEAERLRLKELFERSYRESEPEDDQK
ncbi:MAG: hypothetical protein C4340_04745 [Armatimonadota bacterium]